MSSGEPPTPATRATEPPAPQGPKRFSDEVAARRVMMLFAVSLIVVGIGGFVAVTVGSGGGSSKTTTAAATAPTTTLLNGIPTVVEMGPALDDDLVRYAAARQKDLAKATGDRIAVVSFHQYLPEQEARSAVPGASVVNLLAAIPGGSPAVVSGSIGDWLNTQFASTREERDSIQQLLPTVSDEAFRADYQSRIAELNKTLDSVKPDEPLVFGVVVRAPADVLRRFASDSKVRLVDVAPVSAATADATFRGVRPEETAAANQPPTRPA